MENTNWTVDILWSSIEARPLTVITIVLKYLKITRTFSWNPSNAINHTYSIYLLLGWIIMFPEVNFSCNIFSYNGLEIKDLNLVLLSL